MLHSLLLNLTVVLVPVAVYYFAVIQRHARYENDRAFRSLAELDQSLDREIGRIAYGVEYLTGNRKLFEPGVQDLLEDAFATGTTQDEARTFLVQSKKFLEKREGISNLSASMLLAKIQSARELAASGKSSGVFAPGQDVNALEEAASRFVRAETSCDRACIESLLQWAAESPRTQARAADNQKRKGDETIQEAIHQLDVEGLQLDRVLRTESLDLDRYCNEQPRNAIRLTLDRRQSTPTVTIERCVEVQGAREGARLRARLRLDDLFRSAAGLSEFDDVFLAAQDGAVWATYRRGLEAGRSWRSQLASTSVKGLHFSSLHPLLLRALQQDFVSKDDQGGPGNLADLSNVLGWGQSVRPRGETTFEAVVAGARYRFFARPIDIPADIEVDREAASNGPKQSGGLASPAVAEPSSSPRKVLEASSQEESASAPRGYRLFLVGVRQAAWGREAASSIGPATRLVAILVACAIFLAWPIVRVALWEPLDSLSRWTTRLTVCSAVLLVALLAIAASAYSLHSTFEEWAIRGAERYASAIAFQARKDVEAAVRRTQEMLFKGWTSRNAVANVKAAVADMEVGVASSRLHADEAPVKFALRTCDGFAERPRDDPKFELCAPRQYCALRGIDRAREVFPAWLNMFQTDEGARTVGSTITTFSCRPEDPRSNLLDRGYFQALQRGHGLSMGLEGSQLPKFSVQRLVNRIDGAKMLQVAIPRAADSNGAPPPGGNPSSFRGIVSSDAFVYSLSSAVQPLFYQFVLFDESNGTVLFHSEDKRSLVENLYVEAEQNRRLSAAVEVRRPANLRMSYRGRDHEAAYWPVEGLPWGVVVVFPTSILGEPLLYAALVALFGFLSVFLITAPVLIGVLVLSGLRSLGIRPHWAMRRAYRWMLLLLGLSFFEAALVLPGLRAWSLAVALFLWPWLLALQVVALVGPEAWLKPTRYTWGVAGLGTTMALFFSLAFTGMVSRGEWVEAGIVVVVLTVHAWLLLRATRASLATSKNGAPESWHGEWKAPELLTTTGQAGSSPMRPTAIHSRVLARASRWLGAEADELTYKVRYLSALAVGLVALAALPAAILMGRAYSWQVDSVIHAGLRKTADTFEERAVRIGSNLHRLRPRDPQEQRYMDAWEAAARIPMPGIEATTTGGGAEGGSYYLKIRSEGESAGKPAGDRGGSWLSQPPCLGFGYAPPSRSDWLARVWIALAGSRLTQAQATNLVLESEPGGSSLRRSGSTCAASVQESISLPNGRRVDARLELDDTSRWATRYPVVASAISLSTRGGDSRWLSVAGVVLVSLTFLACVVALARFVAARLLWLDIPWPRRFAPEPGEQYSVDLAETLPFRLVLSRVASWEDRVDETTGARVPDAVLLERIRRITDDARRIDLAPPNGTEKLVRFSGSGDLLLVNLDVALLDVQRRGALLEALEDVLTKRHLNLFIAAEASPLLLVTRPDAFPETEGVADSASPEVQRWVSVFAALDIHHLLPVDPESERQAPDGFAEDVWRTVHRETHLFWPRLSGIRARLKGMASAASTKTGPLQLGDHDIRDLVLAHAGAELRRHWRLCSREERLLLYQLASGRVPNPKSVSIIEPLLRRGFIVLAPEPALASEALREFAKSAEPPQSYDLWTREASEGIWQSLRLPLFLLLMLAIAGVAYTSGDTFQALSAVTAGVLGFVGNLFRAAGYLRGTEPARGA